MSGAAVARGVGARVGLVLLGAFALGASAGLAWSRVGGSPDADARPGAEETAPFESFGPRGDPTDLEALPLRIAAR